MDDYVPPGFIRLADHIESVAREINPELPSSRPDKEQVKAELEAMYRIHESQQGKIESWHDFAGPFVDGIGLQGADLLMPGVTSSHFIRFKQAADVAAAKIADRRKPVLKLASRQIRDALCAGKLKAFSLSLEAIEEKAWMTPASSRFFDPEASDSHKVLLQLPANDGAPGDGGEHQFRTFLEEQYAARGGKQHGKQHYFEAFEQGALFKPTKAALDRAWLSFSRDHPEFEISKAGRKSLKK